MNRLTTKSVLKRSDGQIIEVMYSYGYHSRKDMTYHVIAGNDAIDELGQLEDIKEELGIELQKPLLAIIRGAYAIGTDGIYHIYPLGMTDMMLITDVDDEGDFGGLKFTDYGKKRLGGWALTKEELK